MRKNLLLAAGTALLSSALLLVAATGFVATTMLAYLTPLPLLILGLSHKKDCLFKCFDLLGCLHFSTTHGASAVGQQYVCLVLRI